MSFNSSTPAQIHLSRTEEKLVKAEQSLERKIKRLFMPKTRTDNITLMENYDDYDPTAENLRVKVTKPKSGKMSKFVSSDSLSSTSSSSSNEEHTKRINPVASFLAGRKV
ncbi:hypothetical protein MP638_001038 [Amoeboaphelidium occidentale]|nr:hypothetical protein MP638_001038 [Amoeboaphelidium occidentale]